MNQLLHPELFAVSLGFALLIVLGLVLVLLWLREKLLGVDPQDVPCGTYGVCQQREDCADAHCPGNPCRIRRSHRSDTQAHTPCHVIGSSFLRAKPADFKKQRLNSASTSNNNSTNATQQS